MTRDGTYFDRRLVSLADCPPVLEPDLVDLPPRAIIETYPPGSRDYYRGCRVELWYQNAPGSWLFTRADVPNVMLTKRDLLARAKDPQLCVISIEEYAAPLPDVRHRHSPNVLGTGARADSAEGSESATASLVGTKPGDPTAPEANLR